MFEQLDALLLARIQFAFTVSFHFIFPAFSIGLAATSRCSISVAEDGQAAAFDLQH